MKKKLTKMAALLLCTGALCMGTQTAYAGEWMTVNGHLQYSEGGPSVATGWKEIDGAWYYFSSQGNMETGFQTIHGKNYYLAENGVMLSGRQYLTGGYGADGAWVGRNGETPEQAYLRWAGAETAPWTELDEAAWSRAFEAYGLNTLASPAQGLDTVHVFTYSLAEDEAALYDVWNAFCMKAYRLAGNDASLSAGMTVQGTTLEIRYSYGS